MTNGPHSMSFREQGPAGRAKRGRPQIEDPRPLPPVELPPELITTAEVATLIRRTPRTVRNWVQAGLLTPASLPGPRLFRRLDVMHVLGVCVPDDIEENHKSRQPS